MTVKEFTCAIRRGAYLLPVAALLYAIGQAIHLDVFDRVLSVFASAVWVS